MAEIKERFRFFCNAHPLWALVETWVLGLLILFPLSRVIGHVSSTVFGNGMFMLCGVCGMWMVLRTRIPQMRLSRQVLWELGVGIALSLMMAVGLRPSSALLGWSEVWQQSNLGDPVITVLLLFTGPGYLVARIGLCLWLFWNRLRRRRMLFSLMHLHLTVAAIVITFLALIAVIGAVASGGLGLVDPESGGAIALIADRVFLTVMPAAFVFVVAMFGTLAMLLPPSAILSYFVARRTTRRLEKLAETVRAMREGNYSARVGLAGEDEVAQLQSDFNAMAEELEQTLHSLEAQRDTVSRLLRSRRELMASVSHELRTPVATVRATLESVLGRSEETLSPSLRHDMEVMEGEVLRLQGLIDDLFALAQAEVDRLVLDCCPVDVAPIVQRMVEAMAPLAWNAGRVEVVVESSGTLLLACVDESRLEQILANLLRNGIRHTPPGGIVAVMASAEVDAICIEVRDTGEGIPPEELPLIWERFYRGGSARAEDRRGAGLGLALVKELTEAMGGTVDVESVLGEGSCFTVRLPQA